MEICGSGSDLDPIFLLWIGSDLTPKKSERSTSLGICSFLVLHLCLLFSQQAYKAMFVCWYHIFLSLFSSNFFECVRDDTVCYLAAQGGKERLYGIYISSFFVWSDVRVVCFRSHGSVTGTPACWLWADTPTPRTTDISPFIIRPLMNGFSR